jgi:zinc finger HIT domain-containing protein 1
MALPPVPGTALFAKMQAPPQTGRRSARAKSRSAIRVVDQATRRAVNTSRLASLEQDNYNEEVASGVADALYVDADEDDEYTGGKGKKRKKATSKGGAGRKASRSSSKKKGGGPAADSLEPVVQRVKRLAEIIVEEDYETDETAIPNYLTAKARPSRYPTRQFCTVCGYASTYSCQRCGMRYCGLECLTAHQETRCLKFSS